MEWVFVLFFNRGRPDSYLIHFYKAKVHCAKDTRRRERRRRNGVLEVVGARIG